MQLNTLLRTSEGAALLRASGCTWLVPASGTLPSAMSMHWWPLWSVRTRIGRRVKMVVLCPRNIRGRNRVAFSRHRGTRLVVVVLSVCLRIMGSLAVCAELGLAVGIGKRSGHCLRGNASSRRSSTSRGVGHALVGSGAIWLHLSSNGAENTEERLLLARNFWRVDVGKDVQAARKLNPITAAGGDDESFNFSLTDSDERSMYCTRKQCLC